MTDHTASVEDHRDRAQDVRARCAVLTVSDTRSLADDKSGAIIVQCIEDAGHTVVDRAMLPDDNVEVRRQLQRWLITENVDCLITTGGTGIAARDNTVEAVERLLDRRIDGFGELFRMLSWEEIGPAAMLSRALGGVTGRTLVFALPGSSAAVELAMKKLIIPELPHLAWELRR